MSIGCSIETPTEGFYAWVASGGTGFKANASPLSYKNIWVHFAIVRQTGVVKVYKDGTLVGSI